jgi:hypothetical protein
LTELAPLSPRGKGAGFTRTPNRKSATPALMRETGDHSGRSDACAPIVLKNSLADAV